MAKDPYKLLGLTRAASEAEIRKAYRGLAKKYHPDVNKDNPKAAERFKEISAAHTLLSDKNMKARYDSGQVDGSGQQKNPFAGGFGGSNPFGGMGGGRRRQMAGGQDDMSELFSSLFGMNMGGMRGGMNQRRKPPRKGADIRYKMSLPFIDALKGGQKKLKNGLVVKIPKGADDGHVIRLAGKGKPGIAGGPAGDASVEITLKPHRYFSREGTRLNLTLPVSLKEAVLGAKIPIPLPDGDVTLKIPPASNTGTKMRLKGKGIRGGDLVVTLQLVMDEGEAKSLEKWAKKSRGSKGFNPRRELGA